MTSDYERIDKNGEVLLCTTPELTLLARQLKIAITAPTLRVFLISTSMSPALKQRSETIAYPQQLKLLLCQQEGCGV